MPEDQHKAHDLDRLDEWKEKWMGNRQKDGLIDSLMNGQIDEVIHVLIVRQMDGLIDEVVNGLID